MISRLVVSDRARAWSWRIAAAAISLVIVFSTIRGLRSWLRVDRRQRVVGTARVRRVAGEPPVAGDLDVGLAQFGCRHEQPWSAAVRRDGVADPLVRWAGWRRRGDRHAQRHRRLAGRLGDVPRRRRHGIAHRPGGDCRTGVDAGQRTGLRPLAAERADPRLLARDVSRVGHRGRRRGAVPVVVRLRHVRVADPPGLRLPRPGAADVRDHLRLGSTVATRTRTIRRSARPRTELADRVGRVVGPTAVGTVLRRRTGKHEPAAADRGRRRILRSGNDDHRCGTRHPSDGRGSGLAAVLGTGRVQHVDSTLDVDRHARGTCPVGAGPARARPRRSSVS